MNHHENKTLNFQEDFIQKINRMIQTSDSSSLVFEWTETNNKPRINSDVKYGASIR